MRGGSGQSGQSLIQLMTVVAIMGVLAMLVARLTGKVTAGWISQRLQARQAFTAETARRILASQMRDASIASVVISRQGAGEPMLSKVSWVDPAGSSRTVYQQGQRLYSATWAGSVTAVASPMEVLDESLERFHAYYPNTKDPSKIAFSLVLSKRATSSSPVPAQLSISTELELKNP